MAVHGAAQWSSEPPSPSKTEHATRKNCKPTSARYGSGAFLGIAGAFCLGGKGTFGQGHLGHKTPHLGVMPQPGAIFCGVLSKVAVPQGFSSKLTHSGKRTQSRMQQHPYTHHSAPPQCRRRRRPSWPSPMSRPRRFGSAVRTACALPLALLYAPTLSGSGRSL